jgi:hypothetical protein
VQSLVTSTSPPSNGPGTRARPSTTAAHCEQPVPLKSSRNAATLAATAVACAACDPQLVRTLTNCDLLIYLAVSYILDTTARCQRDHRRGELHPPFIVGGRSSRTERNNRTRPSLTQMLLTSIAPARVYENANDPQCAMLQQ